MSALPQAPATVTAFVVGRANNAGDWTRAKALPPADDVPAGPVRQALEEALVQRDRRAEVLAELHAGLGQRREVHAADQAAERDALQGGRRIPKAGLPAHDQHLDELARRADALASAVAAALAELDAARHSNGQATAVELEPEVERLQEQAAAARQAATAAEARAEQLARLAGWVAWRPGLGEPNEIASGNAVFRAEQAIASVPTRPTSNLGAGVG